MLAKLKNKLPDIFPTILLTAILALSLFLQIFLSRDAVLKDPVRYAADDGIYHMRLIENMLLGGHPFKRLFFDPFTYFPNGAYIIWGPLYEYVLAAFIWIVSLGRPTLDLINKIAPFYPPVLGTLNVLVVYFIGKTVWGRWVGLTSAFFAALSSPLLFRSLLGATDYHQAEALYSSMTVLFLMLALSGPQGKKFMRWVVLSGISFALYFLTFKGALLFLLIIFAALLLYYILEYLAGRNRFWILKAGIVIFTVALVAISFFFGHPDIFNTKLYDIRYAASLLGSIAVFLFVGLLGNTIERRGIARFYLPLTLFALAAGGVLAAKFAFPSAFSYMVKLIGSVNSGMLPYPLIRQLISEMAPLGVGGAFQTFSTHFYLSFLVAAFLLRNFIKRRGGEDLLFIIWFLATVAVTGSLFPAIGTGRYSYYLAVVISLFSGFLLVNGLKFGLKGLSVWREREHEPASIFLLTGSLLVIFNVLYFILYPFPLNLIEKFPDNLPKIIINAVVTAKSPIVAPEDWYKTLQWLKDNTPDPGLDYYGLYEEPQFDPSLGKVRPYDYPPSAYGVLASWDVGHMLVYYAHRMPVANPFQMGIGRGEEPGEAAFFIETDTSKAYQMLDQLRVKYVITDFEGSFAYSAFSTKPQWIIDGLGKYYQTENGETVATGEYDKSMAARLHIMDGRELVSSSTAISALGRMRLLYESDTDIAYIPPGLFGETDATGIKMVKVFEYVKGAVIRGEAPNGRIAEISAKVKTNQNREFVFRQSSAAGGEFSFTLPYAGLYTLKIGGVVREFSISEQEILEGSEIELVF